VDQNTVERIQSIDENMKYLKNKLVLVTDPQFDNLEEIEIIEDISELETEQHQSKKNKIEDKGNDETNDMKYKARISLLDDLIKNEKIETKASFIEKVVDGEKCNPPMDATLNEEMKDIFRSENPNNSTIELEQPNSSNSKNFIPQSAFSVWLRQYKYDQSTPFVPTKPHAIPPIEKIEEKEVSDKKNKIKEEFGEVIAEASKSLFENQDLVSETLANILENQGKIEKAIEMFEKLKLIFPNKSTYFASRIENLNKLI
ncbi:MAG: hypothetical protein KBA06_01100, partial [Saprospiraceae bacterium]|nr:hypothetical protein [Saprospiraceae bacterium]